MFGCSVGDIAYLRLRYVSQILLDGVLRKVIPGDNVAKEATTEVDAAGEKDDDKAKDARVGDVLVEAIFGETKPTGEEKIE